MDSNDATNGKQASHAGGGARHSHAGRSSEGKLDLRRMLLGIRLSPGDCVIDAGCGNGYLAAAMAGVVGPDGSVLAIDADPSSVERARERTAGLRNVRVHLGDATKEIPAGDASVDAFVMVKTLHGFYLNGESDSLFSEVARLLKPTGRVVVVERHMDANGSDHGGERIAEAELDAIMTARGYKRLWGISVAVDHYLASYARGTLSNPISAGEPGNVAEDLATVAGFAHSAKENLPAAILIRHSAREPILDPEHTQEARLTAEGIEMARALGSRLPADVGVRLLHSPVPRCADTARLIADGLRDAGGKPTLVGVRDFLACSYIHDDRPLFEHFDRVGHERFIREWFGGAIPVEWIDPPRKAAERLLESILAEMQVNPDAVHIFVSHDWNVLLLRGLADDSLVEKAPWPGFLSGVLIRHEAGAVIIDWGEGERPLPSGGA